MKNILITIKEACLYLGVITLACGSALALWAFGKKKITEIRANGTLSHFLSYFSVMELSSPFLNSIKTNYNHKMEVIETDIDDVLIIEPRLFRRCSWLFLRELQRARV